MANISIHTILEYYAILCLVMSPVSISLFVVLYRKTNMLERVDRLVDRILGIKPVEPKSETSSKPDAKTNPGSGPAVSAPELSGVACFTLKVNDTYHCRKNAQHFNGGFHEIVWSCDNEFLGDITNEGLFTSKRAGTANIFCARKDDPFASAVQSYSITITPQSDDWFAQWLIDAVSKRTAKADILARNIKWKITGESLEKRIITYEGGRQYGSILLQFDAMENLERGLFILKDADASAMCRLHKELFERFECVRLKNGSHTQVWVHRLIDDARDEVDVYAYIKKKDDGDSVLGFSQNWREYGDIEEFLLNISMAGKMFSDCMPNDVPELLVPEDENPVYMRSETEENEPKEETSPEENGPEKPTENGNVSGSDQENDSLVEENAVPEIKESVPVVPEENPVTIGEDSTESRGKEPGEDIPSEQEDPVNETDFNDDYDQFDDYNYSDEK